MPTSCKKCGAFIMLGIKPSEKCLACRESFCLECLIHPHICADCFPVLNQLPTSVLDSLPVSVLKVYLNERNISTARCIDKSDLVRLIVNNSASSTSSAPTSGHQNYTATPAQPREPPLPPRERVNTAPPPAVDGSGFGDLSSDGFYHPEAFVPTAFTEFVSNIADVFAGFSPPQPHSPGQFEQNSTVRSSQSRNDSPSPPPHYPQYNSQFLLTLSQEMIRSLPTKTIKDILKEQHVSMAGVVERADLIALLQRTVDNERISRGMKPLVQSETQQQSPSKESTSNTQSISVNSGAAEDGDCCRICFENPLNAVLLECGHLCACIDCARLLKECPICRSNIVRVVHTFKA